jgi:hypothetical protein
MKKRFLAKVSAAMILGLGTMVAPAFADLCASTTNCTLNFTLGNAGSQFGSGTFGTLNLALNAAGAPDFAGLQLALASRQHHKLTVFAFDLLHRRFAC